MALKATTLTFEEAATVPTAGMTALQGLRDKGKIQSGQKVLITGASGGVGTFAVQLAKYFGAEVTAMCSTNKLDVVRSLGADRVIDYSKEDVTKMGQRFDLILDIAAYRPFAAYAPILNPDGIYVLAGGALGRIFRAMLLGPLASIGKRQTFGNVAAQPTQKDLLTLKELLEAGKVRPVIDRCYTLEELAEAMRYFGDRHVRGKVAITVGA
ncbi:MAG: NAD(P)-dependent alcohol dehydrogenase [Anaerolineae bacterium]